MTDSRPQTDCRLGDIDTALQLISDLLFHANRAKLSLEAIHVLLDRIAADGPAICDTVESWVNH
jgi:hypothetical protein